MSTRCPVCPIADTTGRFMSTRGIPSLLPPSWRPSHSAVRAPQSLQWPPFVRCGAGAGIAGTRFGWAHRRGGEAVPVIRPVPSRNVVVPLLSRVAVPVVRPEPSRNVRVPFESVVTVPVMRPLASRNVVDCCADAAVTMTNISPTMQNIFIVSLRRRPPQHFYIEREYVQFG
jgi:hypothetical protein